MKNVTILAALAAGASLLGACAKHTHEIQPQYISPTQYSSYSCRQIEQEMQMLSSRVTQVGAQVDDEASSDSAEMAVGMVLFWPALFFLDGDTPQAAEYARLRGEFDALEKAAIQKDCGLQVARPVAPVAEKPAPSPAYPSRRP